MISKKEIKAICLQLINDKIAMLQKAMDEAQASANNESKSSAGDKHETSRAMAQLENERLTKQLHKQLALKEALAKISDSEQHDSITLGSYIETSGGNFYLSVGLGKIEEQEHQFFATPLHSPVGKQLAGKKKGDAFLFNKQQHTISNIQ